MSTAAPAPLHHERHEGEGPAMLLVHGMLSSRAQWAPNLEALRRVGSPVVVELYGHGRSPAPDAPEAYRPEAYVEAFEELRVELGVDRWLLVGQSLGAALTLRYALDHPDRVIRHVMTNSMSAFCDPEWAAQMRAAMEGFQRSVERHGRDAIERLAIHPKNARRIAPALRDALVQDVALHDPRGVALTGANTTPHSVLNRLSDSRVPTLLVHGTRERRFAPQLERARAHMPGLEVVELDTGHAVNLEDPPGFDAAACAFLARR